MKKIYYLINIFLLLLASYIIMVFISHFSIYNKEIDYKISDSFEAMLLKTDVPAEFLLISGALGIGFVILALIFNYFSQNKTL